MRTFAVGASTLAAAACGGGGGGGSPDAVPALAVVGPGLGLVHDDPADNPDGVVRIAVHGALGAAVTGTWAAEDCGTPRGGTFAIARDAAGAAIAIAGSSAPSLWAADRAVFELPAAATAATQLDVCTPLGSARVAVELWDYAHVDLPPSPGTNPSPLATAIDDAGRVWVDEEFHLQLKGVTPPSTITVEDIPQAAGPGIFAQTVFGDTPTHTAILGEDIAVTPDGRVWFTESGIAPYDGPNPNHSRLVAYDPATRAMAVYNVPGDDNGIVGLAWDAQRGRMWFTQGRRGLRQGLDLHIALPARLTSFDPARITPDPTFDFAPSETCVIPGGDVVGTCSATTTRACLTDVDCVLATAVCPPGITDDSACFHDYALASDIELPAHVMAHSDGSIWYAGYWGGNNIGRLDPATGAVTVFPLSDPDGQAACDYDSCSCFFPPPPEPCPAICCQYLLLGWGPWSVIEDPPTGDVLFCGQTSLQIGRIAGTAASDSRCSSLDGGENPCVTEWTVPSLDPATDLVHSIARGADGRIWVTDSPAGADAQHDPDHPASVGFLDAASNRVLMFPPLSRYPFTDTTGGFVSFGGAGIAVAGANTVWFADYFRHRLGTLVRR